MRDIDVIINYVNGQTSLSAVERRILVNRIDQKPTQDEILQAQAELFGDAPELFSTGVVR